MIHHVAVPDSILCSGYDWAVSEFSNVQVRVVLVFFTLSFRERGPPHDLLEDLSPTLCDSASLSGSLLHGDFPPGTNPQLSLTPQVDGHVGVLDIPTGIAVTLQTPIPSLVDCDQETTHCGCARIQAGP